jgi:putative ABC transport system substrate-binding protein
MRNHIRRREFICFLGGAAAAPLLLWPLNGRAQQRNRVRLIGVSMNADEPTTQARIARLARSLQELGWIDGRNIRIEHRSSAIALARFPATAAELIALNPDVIVATNTPFVQELQRQTKTIPIVFINLGDPVETGLVASLARPGGNVTGFMNYLPVVAGKWLELLKEAAPTVNRVLVLVNSGNKANENLARVAEASGPSLGLRVTSAALRDIADILAAIETVAAEPNAGLVGLPGTPLSDRGRGTVHALADRYRLPAIYGGRAEPASGGLMSYGADTEDMWRLAAPYVDRILKGEKSGDLPVQAPVKYELVVNLKAAKAIGLTIPEAFLLRADEVIE